MTCLEALKTSEKINKINENLRFRRSTRSGLFHGHIKKKKRIINSDGKIYFTNFLLLSNISRNKKLFLYFKWRNETIDVISIVLRI